MAKDKHSVAEEKAASTKMRRKEFEKELAKLQIELTRLQTWVQATGARIIVVFEGRDTAGKGGVISRITTRTSARVYRHVAFPCATETSCRCANLRASNTARNIRSSGGEIESRP